ncbi:DUF2167 domain-containing protein [Parachitinimonas caeni]|uniref:DUF2167 domain-containing protein n=1 Tax=Parachitinimonas caeni TaxID=3031301 RepID=A0ABT7DU49_9NEIS|nr:DUF2167 domain-containing protein [Parachitinimonas caeni]MDK2123566.1 DUF2167 domain-containing protein [Parachitinimonas caeni]
MIVNALRSLILALPLIVINANAEEPTSLANTPLTSGPSDVPFLNQAVLKLPSGYAFMDKEHGAKLMRQVGNSVNDSTFLGLIMPEQSGKNWFVVAEYEPSGYIKDDDAKDWDADDLLKSLREGTEAGNKERRARNIPEFDVTGWLEKPNYQSSNHRLVWAALTKEKNAAANQGLGVNYNTYALGREGYISLNLVTEASSVETDKAAAKELLSALQFNNGKRYEDFNSSTDHVAEYGLAALVAGVAAKKLGFLAMIGVFFTKFFKIIAVAAIGLVAGIKRLFNRSSD